MLWHTRTKRSCVTALCGNWSPPIRRLWPRVWRLQTSVRPARGFLFMLWCQRTGQCGRKHWWQNTADPAKPHNGSSWLTLKTRLTEPTARQGSGTQQQLHLLVSPADHKAVGLKWALCVLWGQCFGKMESSSEKLSVFLENVRQEMPKAHLEVLHFHEAHAWQPRPSALHAHLVLHSFVQKSNCNNRTQKCWYECALCQALLAVLNKSCVC